MEWSLLKFPSKSWDIGDMQAVFFFSKSWICDKIMLLTTPRLFVRLVLCVMPLRWSVSPLMDWLLDALYTWSTSCTLAWMHPLKYVSRREKRKYRIDDCHIVCGCTQGYLQGQWIYRDFGRKCPHMDNDGCVCVNGNPWILIRNNRSGKPFSYSRKRHKNKKKHDKKATHATLRTRHSQTSHLLNNATAGMNIDWRVIVCDSVRSIRDTSCYTHMQ